MLIRCKTFREMGLTPQKVTLITVKVKVNIHFRGTYADRTANLRAAHNWVRPIN